MRVLLLVFAVVAVVLAKDSCDGDDWGTSGDFDFYVYQQSWSAQYCKGSSYPGCKNPIPTMKTNLTIHGMWPNYASEQSGHWWPQCCQSSAGQSLTNAVYQALKNQLWECWPNEEDPQPTKVTDSLWDHEWNKHGTCSGLAQKDYFNSGISVDFTLGTPSLITDNVGGSVSVSQLESVYNGSPCPRGGACKVVVGCTDGELSDITTCWDKDLNQMVCPAEVVSTDNQCTDSTVNILSFDQL